MKALAPNRAISELLLATLFWGFGYVATIWALDIATPVEITFLRFFAGGLLSLFLVRSFQVSKERFFYLIRLSFFPGFCMAALLLSQTWGLQYTTAINSTFITALYVVITPLLEWGVLRRKSHLVFLLYAGLSLCGVLFILKGSFQVSSHPLSWLGDLLTLITAFFSACHLVYVGQVWKKIHRPFLFNALQSLWAALLLFPFLLVEFFFSSIEFERGALTPESVVGLISLVFGSTILAFYLQLRAQSVLSPSLTSLICLLESPMALIFALIFLSQPLGLWALLGASLIFLSAIGATLTESFLKKSE